MILKPEEALNKYKELSIAYTFRITDGFSDLMALSVIVNVGKVKTHIQDSKSTVCFSTINKTEIGGIKKHKNAKWMVIVTS